MPALEKDVSKLLSVQNADRQKNVPCLLLPARGCWRPCHSASLRGTQLPEGTSGEVSFRSRNHDELDWFASYTQTLGLKQLRHLQGMFA
jgi:hypothetical protein